MILPHAPQTGGQAEDELRRQYELVLRSLDYNGLAVGALLLNYYALEQQKDRLGQLLQGAGEPMEELNQFPILFTAALMVLSASSFFADLSQDALSRTPEGSTLQESLQLSNLVNNLVLAAAAVKIYNLLLTETGPRPESAIPLQTDIELEDTFPL